MKELTESLKAYDLGQGLPKSDDVQGVADYIEKLLDL
jgi:hypothetical protein